MGALGTGLVWLGFAGLVGTVGWWAASAITGPAARPHRAGSGSPPADRGDREVAADREAAADRAARSADRTAAALDVGGAVLLAGSLALPWLRGTGTDGAPLTLTGWSGLDPLSVGALLVGAALVVVVAAGLVRHPHGQPDRGRAATLLGFGAAGLALLVGGNLLVQADQPGGSRVAPAGFVVALAGAALIGAAAGLVGAARRRAGRSPA